MDPALTGLWGALGGVCVSSLAEAWRSHTSFRREKSWSHHEEQRGILEQVYEALEQVRESYRQGYLDTTRTVRAQQLVQHTSPYIKVPWAKIRMLVHLYTPELTAYLDTIEQTGPDLGSAMATAVMESSTDRNKNEQLITSMYDRYKQFDKSVDQMRDAIVERSRKLAEHTSAVTNKRFQWLKWKQNNQYK